MKVLSFAPKTFLTYAISGAAATLIDWGSFYALNYILHVNYLIAVCISFALGSLANFLLNKYVTFKNKHAKVLNQYLLHLSVSIFALGLTVLIMYILVETATLPKFTARVITTLIMLLINYFLHKNITFGVLK